MKIAIIIRGQPRQYSAGCSLLRHFLIDKFPDIEFQFMYMHGQAAHHQLLAY